VEEIAQRNKELYDVYFSPNIISVTKSRIVRWAVHVVRMGRAEVRTGFWLRDLMERNHLENIDVDWRIILRWIFKKWNGELWTVMTWLRIGRGIGLLVMR